MKRVSLSLMLCACVGSAPVAAPPADSPSTVLTPVFVADAGATDATTPTQVDAGVPVAMGDECSREAAAALVADVAVAALPKLEPVDGSVGALSQTPVFRGSIYQRATLAVGQHQALRVPANARVAEGAKAGTLEVFVAKTLSFAGHPPEAMGPEAVRHNLGLATTDDGMTLVLATYGEFDTRIEGGASVQVFVRVPKGFSVRTSPGLAGDQSEPSRWPTDAASIRASESGRVGYWYAPVNPRKGWSRVKLADDKQRVASHAGPYPPLAAPCAP